MLNDFIEQFGPSTVGGLVAGSIYALVALGYTMVYGVLRLINFAHSEIFMIGTFATLFVLSLIGLPGPLTGLALVGMIVLLIVAAMAASGGAAVLLEILAYRPLRKRNAPRLAALISAIGASVFLQELFALVVIPDVFNKPGRIDTAVPRLVDRDTVFTVFGADIKTDQLVIFIAAVVMMVALDQLVARTRIGRGIRATAQDPEAAVLMGVNIDTIVRLTLVTYRSRCPLDGKRSPPWRWRVSVSGFPSALSPSPRASPPRRRWRCPRRPSAARPRSAPPASWVPAAAGRARR
ncbi:MAG: branched-chain amino acid transport system permease protein [Pseudonocardiales bacterium]|nr:branched-chain amino acid transport system permease protein [Pseudonocardiales bacterium]